MSTKDDGFLDKAIDIALAELRKNGGDPRPLREPLRVVATVNAAQGVIDNGGLSYFLGPDWPGEPPYSLFAEAYRTIGAIAEAAAIEAGAALFAFPDPERDCARRRECLSGAAGARIDELDRGLGSDVWRLLADYVELHRSAFDNRQ